MAQTPVTKPVLASAWQSDALDTGTIHDELNRLWAALGGPRHGGDAPGEMVAEPHFGGGGLMRANTLNLIAVANDMREVHLIQETIAGLHDFLPSRTIILITHDGYDPEGEVTGPRYDVRVELKEQVVDKDEANLRFEVITIGADRREVGHLASLVTPLLAADLTDFLWWPGGDFTRSSLFDDLLPVVDRLIVDTAHLGRDIHALTALRSAIAEGSGSPIVGDFTWLRLEPWRQLIAQFFDAPDVQRCLQTIDQVTIHYAETRQDGSSGLAAALMMAGWLGSRLDWQAIDPLERQKRGGYWAPLRASSEEGRGRDIELTLTPDTSPQARFSLRRVTIVATGAAPGTFMVERTDGDDIITTSETPDNPAVSRMVYSQRLDSGDMIGRELQRFGPDEVFEETVRWAVQLIPE
jgi:glucose-6-phosphate dehydrogenase assembly protein OpcA